MPRNHAFSLIEILIVLVMMGVLAGLAVPRFANAAARYRAEMSARRVAADLVLAGTQARQMGKPVVVSFNTSTSRYTLSDVEDLAHRAGNYTVDLTTEPYRVRLGSVSFAGDPQVTFNMYGMPSAGGQVVVHCGSYSKTAVLDQDSGKANVQ